MTDEQTDEQKMGKFKKGVWFWQKEWWWAIAINELIRRKLKDNPGNSVTITMNEVNVVLDELAGSVRKRLKMMAVSPARVKIEGPQEIIVGPN